MNRPVLVKYVKRQPIEEADKLVLRDCERLGLIGIGFDTEKQKTWARLNEDCKKFLGINADEEVLFKYVEKRPIEPADELLLREYENVGFVRILEKEKEAQVSGSGKKFLGLESAESNPAA